LAAPVARLRANEGAEGASCRSRAERAIAPLLGRGDDDESRGWCVRACVRACAGPARLSARASASRVCACAPTLRLLLVLVVGRAEADGARVSPPRSSHRQLQQQLQRPRGVPPLPTPPCRRGPFVLPPARGKTRAKEKRRTVASHFEGGK
jgi:hypothetical protein